MHFKSGSKTSEPKIIFSELILVNPNLHFEPWKTDAGLKVSDEKPMDGEKKAIYERQDVVQVLR